jgi:YfiH family protein
VVNQVDWIPAGGVHSFVTTRQGGCSEGNFAAFNLALHVGDDANAVARNRSLLLGSLRQQCAQPALQIQWMQQVHGTEILRCAGNVIEPPPQADALYTTEPNIVLGVLTADCLPVLFASADGSEIAVAHAGWRGLCNGVLEATLANFRCTSSQMRCWLGPGIGPCHFEVGEEVRAAFLQRATPQQQAAIAAAFTPGVQAGKWQGDLYALARLRLLAAGVQKVTGEVLCTVCHADRFYSYRKQAVTGRFATLIVRSA